MCTRHRGRTKAAATPATAAITTIPRIRPPNRSALLEQAPVPADLGQHDKGDPGGHGSSKPYPPERVGGCPEDVGRQAGAIRHFLEEPGHDKGANQQGRTAAHPDMGPGGADEDVDDGQGG